MILDVLATPNQPLLLPSTTRSIASKAWAWFFVIASIFILFPMALIVSFFSFVLFFNQHFLEEFFAVWSFVLLGVCLFFDKADKDMLLTCSMQSHSYFLTSSPYTVLLGSFLSAFDTIEAIYHICILIT